MLCCIVGVILTGSQRTACSTEYVNVWGSVSALLYINITSIHITGLYSRKIWLIFDSLRICIIVCSQMTLVLLVQGQILGSSTFWRVERMKLMFIMESVALQLGILLPLAVHSEPQSAVHFVFWSSRNQSAGDKLYYFTFFEFSQGVLSLPLLVLALFCYFKDLLVFPRWFFPWCQGVWYVLVFE